MNFLLSFPKYATECLKTITDNGYEAYFVGGCVRDGLLGRECFDIDITTSALPTDIQAMFKNTLPTGIKHGTITVISDGNPIEITTYRKEDGYRDSRHPENVSFVSTLNDDLARRDFTINALAYSTGPNIIDLFNGMKDLKNQIIKAVGNPEKRFSEDALRIIRAYRFASVLGFSIEEKTANAALKSAEKISKISGERVLVELIKTAAGQRPSYICELLCTGALSDFGLNSPLFNNSVFDRISMLDIDDSSKISLFVLLCKHSVEKIKFSLKASNVIIDKITILNSMISGNIPCNKPELKKILYKYGLSHTRLYLYYLLITENICDNKLFDLLDDIISKNEAYMISQLSIDGNDLKNMGISERNIGKLLEETLYLVIEDKIENSREVLLKNIKN